MKNFVTIKEHSPEVGSIVFEPIGFDGVGGFEFVEVKVLEVHEDGIYVDEHNTSQTTLKDFMAQKLRKINSWYIY